MILARLKNWLRGIREPDKCIQCGNPAFRHPQTGKIYKLCAICGLEAICRLFEWEYDRDTSLIEQSKRLGDLVSVRGIDTE